MPLNQLQAGNGPMRVWGVFVLYTLLCVCVCVCVCVVHIGVCLWETGEWTQAQLPQRQPPTHPNKT